MDAVNLRGVSFRYRGQVKPALRALDLQAAAGERLGVVGLTGAGKSTLLRCLNRIVPSSFKGEFEGRVELFGSDLSLKRPSQLADQVGMVFQDFESQLFASAAELDVAFGPENLGLPGDEIRDRVRQSLAAVGLQGLERRDPATLSGGQKQRLAIASVLSLDPRILGLDEPTTDLDPEGRAEIAQLLSALSARGMTVIVAEHELELLLAADRIVGLENGEKILDAPAATLLRDDTLLAGLGVRPPDAVQLLHRLGLPERTLDPAEAAAVIAGHGFALAPGAAAQLLAADQKAREREGEAMIEVQALAHTYPSGAGALDAVDLYVRRGEFVALLGRNGSGKTTLVKHLNGLLRPTAGEVRIGGRSTRECETGELGRRVGFVFQDPDHQIFAGRVYDEIAFAPRNHGFKEDEVKTRVTRSLEQVGLGGREECDPFLLTKGERQRVALASVLAAEPEVIVLDEPTTGLDYPAQRAVMELLAELNRAGRTVIVITHALWVAAEYSRRAVVLDRGRVMADGPTRAVMTDPELMARAGLRPPGAVELGHRLGAPALAVSEIAALLSRP